MSNKPQKPGDRLQPAVSTTTVLPGPLRLHPASLQMMVCSPSGDENDHSPIKLLAQKMK